MRIPPIPPRQAISTALLLGALAAAPWALGDASAKTEVAPAAPLVTNSGPILSDPAELNGAKGTAWEEKTPEGTAQFLLLEGDPIGGMVAFKVGTHAFSASRAVVKITQEPTATGAIRHLTLYLENARSSGEDTVGAEAPRLLVTAATTGAVRVSATLMKQAKAAPGDDFVAAAQKRMAMPAPAPEENAPAQATSGELPKSRRAKREAADKAAPPAPVSPPAEAPEAPPPAPAKKPAPSLSDLPHLPGLPQSGVGTASGPVHSSADHLEVRRGENGAEDAVLLTGHVRLSWEYAGHLVEVQAESAVIYLKQSAGAALDGTDASKMSGIYLEDNAIISDGQYTVRAPRMYYDVAHNRATLLDAVMYAVDTQFHVPLYLRADLLRQHAADAFEARGVTIANNGFAEPSFAIGASRITVTRLPTDPADPSARERGRLTVEDATPRIEGVPAAWLPYAALPGWRIPLRSASVSQSNRDGTTARTNWGVYDLLDIPPPEGEDMSADLDYRGNHGGALGGDYKYNREDSFGRLHVYDLPQDKGTDRLAGRDDIEHNGENRDFLRFEHRHYLTPETELTLQAAHASDPSMQETFFQDYTERPPESGASLKHAHEDWAVSATASMQLDRFTPSLAELEARGFQTERLEGEFRRIGTELFDGKANWFSENRVGRVRAAVGRDAPEDRGIADWASVPEFGIPSTASYRSAAAANGIPTTWVNRVDTRQELDVPLQSGPVDVTPFALVRYTQWSPNVEVPGGAEDTKRLYGGGGVRLATELVGTASDFSSEWLDVNGLRHVVRPEADLGWYGSSMNSGTLPMFDPDVEGLGEGGIARLGLVNAWQTHRGEGNNRRVVDWIRFKQDFIWRTGEDDPHRAVPRYVDWRPEYALGGSHAHSELLWQTTDALAMNGEAVYAFDSAQVEQWSAGATFTHSDRLTSRLSYLDTRMFDEHLVSYGVNYRLTPKYDIAVSQSFDLGPSGTGLFNASVNRKIPGGTLQVIGSYDELNSSYSIGIAFSPQGMGNNSLGSNVYRRDPR